MLVLIIFSISVWERVLCEILWGNLCCFNKEDIVCNDYFVHLADVLTRCQLKAPHTDWSPVASEDEFKDV